jgi:NAD(P)-dependent dehydrogenase (short-subunit alcohol dehydrogenase family)
MSKKETVVITGGASGIGRESARQFAASGADIIVSDIDLKGAKDTIESLSGDGERQAVETDVRDSNSVSALFETVKKSFDGIDVLINCAGLSQTVEPTVEQSVEEWERVIDVHLKGAYLCSKFALEGMLEQGFGNIINISSIAGLGGFPYRTAYGPAKSGINMLTKCLAIETADQGVRVNAVAPGYVRTPMVMELVNQGKFEISPLEERTPIGRLADPEDIVNAIEFLTSDQADYITGVVLPVDGGWNAYGYV